MSNAEDINAPEILLFLPHTQNHTCVFIIVYVQGGIYLGSPPQSTGMVGEKREENALTRTHIYLLMFPSFKALCCLPEFPPSVKFFVFKQPVGASGRKKNYMYFADSI